MAKKKKKGKGAGSPLGPPVEAGEKELTALLEDKVKADLADDSVLKLGDKYSEESDKLRDTLESTRGKLLDLDPETAASLDRQQTAREALLSRRFGEEKDLLLGRLFGSGIERSTIAGRMGGQLIGDQSLVLQQSQAAHEANVLNTRMGLTDQSLRNIGMQASILDSDRQGELANLQLQAQQISDARNRRAGLLSGAYDRRGRERVATIGANAQITSSRISASAQVRSATLAAEASKYGSDRALAAARVRADATKYAASASASASRYGADRSYEASALHAEASRFNTEARLRTDIMGLEQSGYQFGENLAQRQHEFQTEDERARDFFTRDLSFRNRELDVQRQISRDQARAQRRSSAMGMLGGVLGGLIGLSDEGLKEEIGPIEDALEKLRAISGFEWKWKSNHSPGAGVVAQDLEKVMPEAVKDHLGVKVVDYAAVIGLLIEAVKELSKERD